MYDNSEIIQVNQAEMLGAINRAEIDVQVATAKAYPRNIAEVLNKIETIATLDAETAEDCFYALRRGEGDRQRLIEGVSVRMAEIIAGAWGNLRIQTRIAGNDGKMVTAQAMCHDLESNLAVCIEVKRRITDSRGRTFGEDMQTVTANAASAIAFRNAVLKVVPKSVTNNVMKRVKEVAVGKAMDLETRRQRMVEFFAKAGVTATEIADYCGVTSVKDLDASMVMELRGLANAIKDGTTTAREAFGSTRETKPQTNQPNPASSVLDAINNAISTTKIQA